MEELHFALMEELGNPLLNKSLTKRKRKKHALEEDQQLYIELRNKHPEAESSSWMTKNEHALYFRAAKTHKLRWHEFKLSCGFNDHDRNKKYTLEELRKEYINLRKEHPEAHSSKWMEKNGHRALYQRVRNYNLSWHDFKLSCGFNDFDKNKTYTLEEDQQSYIELRKEHPEANSSDWMEKNGHRGLYQRIKRIHKMKWHDFKLSCGFNDFDKNKTYTLEEDQQSYIELRKEHLNQAIG
jgi:hypothetical protein